MSPIRSVASLVTALSFVLAPLSGCASTEPSLSASGDPLRVDIQTNKEVMVKYNSRYEPGTYQWLDGLYQGEQKIEDELDFYHIVGDEEKVADIIGWRKQSAFASMVAWGGFGAGLAVLLGSVGYTVAMGGFNEGNVEAFAASTGGQVAFGGMAAGGVIMGMAPMLGYFMLAPKQQIMVETPENGSWTYELLYPREAAYRTAEQYNQSLAAPAQPAEAAPAPPAEAPPAQ
jgi:hypothetical protein